MSMLSAALLERKPGRPENVTVVQLPDGGLLISWSPASHNSSSGAQYYVVEYRTVGPWVRLSGPLRAGAGVTPDFRWTTASRGATYHFRVLAYSADNVASEPSNIISLHTGGKSSLFFLPKALAKGRGVALAARKGKRVMPSFHSSIPLPFCRWRTANQRCGHFIPIRIRKDVSSNSVLAASRAQRQRQLRNGRTATECWKPGIS